MRKSVPDATFIIAGYGPPEDLTSLQKENPHVIVTCFVEDIDECCKKASVVRLLKDPAQPAEIRKSGQYFVKTNVSLESIISKIESAYGELVKRES